MRKPKKPDITKEPFPTQEEVWEWERYKADRDARIALIISVSVLLIKIFT